MEHDCNRSLLCIWYCVFQIKYHEEYEKQKGKKITVADDPEMQRVRHNMEVISNVSYHGERERRSQMEMARPAEQVEGDYFAVSL